MLAVGSIAVAATVGWLALAPVGHPADGSAEPTAGGGSSASNSSGNGNSRDIAWRTDHREALAEAKTAGKPLVIDFFAAWCGPCQVMEQTTFADKRVQQRMNDFIPLRIDVDRQPETASRYGIRGLPTTVIVTDDGRPVTRAVGYLDAERFLSLINGAQRTASGGGEPADAPLPKRGILGRAAPPLGVKIWFNLPGGRQSIDVDNHRGQVVYLYGFQSWCPGCHRQGFPTLLKLINHYRGDDRVAFIAVQTAFEGFSANSPESAQRTAERYGLSIPVGHSGSADEPSAMMRRYRTGGTPWTVIIDRNGIVRYNDFHIQPDDAIALIDRLRKSTP